MIRMKKSFTPNEELVLLFLKKHAKSTAAEIGLHTALKQRGIIRRALDGLDAKGMLRHTDNRDERYYPVHSR
jgi:DNA-binding MarR family transcriptional regulator